MVLINHIIYILPLCYSLNFMPLVNPSTNLDSVQSSYYLHQIFTFIYLKDLPLHIFSCLIWDWFAELIGRHSRYKKHNDAILYSDCCGNEWSAGALIYLALQSKKYWRSIGWKILPRKHSFIKKEGRLENVHLLQKRWFFVRICMHLPVCLLSTLPATTYE